MAAVRIRPAGTLGAQPRAPRLARGRSRRSREASGNSPSSTPSVAGPERRGWSSILMPSSILAQSGGPRGKHLSKDSGPVAMSMSGGAARRSGRRGEALPGGGASSAPRRAGRGDTLRPGGRSRFYFYLEDMRSVSCPGFQRRGAKAGAGAAAHGAAPLHGRAHAAHTAPGSRGVTCSPAAPDPRPAWRGGPSRGGPCRAERGPGGARGSRRSQPLSRAAARGAAPFRAGAAAEEHTPRRLTPPQTC